MTAMKLSKSVFCIQKNPKEQICVSLVKSTDRAIGLILDACLPDQIHHCLSEFGSAAARLLVRFLFPSLHEMKGRSYGLARFFYISCNFSISRKAQRDG